MSGLGSTASAAAAPPTDCQYSPHHNHRIRRPLGRVQGGDGCQVSSCSHKLQTTRYTATSIQPGYLQTVSNARDNGQVRAMNGIYKSDSSLITLLLALCIPGVACAVCRVCMCQVLRPLSAQPGFVFWSQDKHELWPDM